MRASTFAVLAAAAGLAAPAFAQDADGAFNGPYIGGSVGYGFQRNNPNEFQSFDRGFNGRADTITTTTGANAFSPGFCSGAAQGPTPAAGCENDKDDLEYHVRAGWDVQSGDSYVLGVVGDFGKSEIVDSVSSFSTTPASYTMTREIDWEAGLRLRAGYLIDPLTLAYVTGGGAYAKIKNSFATTNGVNAFQDNGDSESWGFSVGTGVERSFGNISVGVEYLYTGYTDDDYRVRAIQGNAVASNPFILNGQPGTEFSRSDERFDRHALRLTAALRF